VVDILTLLLLLCVTIVPSNLVVRVGLGLPLLLFFPGYVLVAALYGNKKRLPDLERFALSFGLSVMIAAFIGLILNYTPWGIRLEPVLISITVFTLLTSCVALMRNSESGWTTELRLPGWGHDPFENSLSIILIAGLIGALAVLAYVIAMPKVGEQFTDFYLLGSTLKAESFPTVFSLNQGQVVGVSYDGGKTLANSDKGEVTLGIINHEAQLASYQIKVQIDGRPIDFDYAGKTLNRLDNLDLQPGEKWQQKIGFAPQTTGNQQKVEFVLFEDGELTPFNTLQLWINVK
jgi:uncharacterized membrane protein